MRQYFAGFYFRDINKQKSGASEFALQTFSTSFYFLKKSTFDDSTKDIPSNLHESSDSKEDDLYTKFLQICFISRQKIRNRSNH